MAFAAATEATVMATDEPLGLGGAGWPMRRRSAPTEAITSRSIS